MAWVQGRHLLPGPDLPAEARPPPAHHRLPHTDRLQVHFLTLPLYIIQLWALEKASNFFPMYLPILYIVADPKNEIPDLDPALNFPSSDPDPGKSIFGKKHTLKGQCHENFVLTETVGF